MFSVSKIPVIFLVLTAAVSCVAAPVLRVCADPNNLPYSNKQRQGFENKLAELVAKDLGMQISYFWFPQRDAFFRKTLNSGLCDVVMGVPTGFEEADTTQPYYRSTYVFVSRRDYKLKISSFDDPRLKELRIGVNVLGHSDDSLPPVQALASRGIVRNVVGYSIFGGNLTEANPPADLIEAVSTNHVDVAIAWGPQAGYFARRSAVPLDVTPAKSDLAYPNLPLTFEIGIGVRKGDVALKKRLDTELERLRLQIRRLLRSYGIPQLSLTSPSGAIVEN
jgi:mxaJ protein